MGVLLDENTRVVIQGMGAAGAREARTCLDYGTKVVAGVTPGRGGQEIEGVPIFNTVRQAVDGVRRERVAHLRAGRLRRRRHPRGGRRGLPARHLHHRGHPDARHGDGEALPTRLLDDTHRPELPRRDHAPARCRVGIMPGNVFTAGQRRRHLALRHAGLRGGRPAHAPRHRPVDLRRRRRRPDHRHDAARRRSRCSTTTPTRRPSS